MKLNYPASFYNLGLLYEQSVDKTVRRQANTLFEKAAELGLLEAKKKLGHSLQSKKTDEDEIHGKCKMCKDIGWQESENINVTIPTSSPETCFTLARAYHFGTSGMPQDQKYALELYREAAINGHEKSKRAYEELKSSLSTDPLKNKKTKDPYRNNLIGREGKWFYKTWTRLSCNLQQPPETNHRWLPNIFCSNLCQGNTIAGT